VLLRRRPTAGAPEACGHPSDKWGFVVGGALRLNFPMIAQGDFFQTRVTYTQGALHYVFMANNENYWMERGRNAAFGVVTDAVFGSSALGTRNTNGTGLELTTGWNVNAAYEHYWTPQLHETFYGDLAEVRYDTLANALLCNAEGLGTGATGSHSVAPTGCNNNWNTWWVGSRVQYDFTKTLYMGVDFFYTKIDSAQMPGGIMPVAAIPAGTAQNKLVAHENNLGVRFRVHKDFLP
jgi:hypothetical protein